MTRQDVINAIANCNYSYVGIRHLAKDESYSIGDYCRNSYDWDYEYDRSAYDTDDPIDLGGTCAYNTKIEPAYDDMQEIEEKLEKAMLEANYIGTPVLIAGNRATCGNDDGELIIVDAVVIATNVVTVLFPSEY